MRKIPVPGYPELPVFYLHYIIPPNKIAEGVLINSQYPIEIFGSYNIYPSQPSFPISMRPEWVDPDSTIYSQDSLFPGKAVEVVSNEVFDGARIVTIAVYPFQYYPLGVENEDAFTIYTNPYYSTSR